MQSTGLSVKSFQIGTEFETMPGMHWRVTDVGQRTIVAIRVDRGVLFEMDGTKPDGMPNFKTLNYTREEAAEQGLFDGPPYGAGEQVFDELSIELSITILDNAWADVDPLLRQGKNISAIKQYMQRFRCTLPMAKANVEQRIAVLFPPKEK